MTPLWVKLLVLLSGVAVVAGAAARDRLLAGSFVRLLAGGDRRFAAFVEDLRGMPALVYLSGAGAVLIATVLGAAMGASAAGGTAAPLDGAEGVPATTLRAGAILSWSAYAGAGAVAAGMLAYLGREGRRAMGVGGGGVGALAADVGRGVAWLAAALPVCFAMGWLGSVGHALFSGGERPDEIAHEKLAEMVSATGDPWVWVVVAAAVIGAPVVEEFLYRACVQSALMVVFARVMSGLGWSAVSPEAGAVARGAWPAIVVSSAIFAVVHVGQVPWHALPVLFALSVALGVVYARTGRLLTPIVMHAGFNAVNVAAAMAVA